MLYGAAAVVALALLVGGFLALGSPFGAVEAPSAGTPTTRTPRVAAAPPPAEPVPLTSAQSDRVTRLVGDARRFAAAEKFSEADGALREAEAVAPGQAEIAQARRDIAEMRTPQGHLTRLVIKARSAIERADYAAADQAIGEAERLNPTAVEVTELRRDLQASQQKETAKNDRLTSLLARMRSALASNDMAGANQALNEAERLDVQNPAVLEARADLDRAQNPAPPPAPKN